MRRVEIRNSPLSRFFGACFMVRALVLILAVLIVSGIGHVLNSPARDESHEATVLVEALIDRRPDFPLDVEGVTPRLGYTPVNESGAWINPDGSCSTPLPVGPEAFNASCRSHDLGYDALRLAAVDDSTLGSWARFGLDARLYADLLDSCDSARCRAMATVYFGAVTANSIRQGYRPPTEEPVLPWAGLGAAIVGVAALSPRIPWWVRPKSAS
ncbi:MAG TPA: hypothetical protein VEB69_00260 [Acidimicrobiia bacterium]|nr:hypothetical protein [Acidimicrobiia bacterium]